MRWLAHVVGILQSVCLVVLLASAGWSDSLFALTLGVILGVGWILAARLPRHPMGWLLLAVSGPFLVAMPLGLWGTGLVETHPGVAAWLLWLGWSEEAFIWLPAVGILFTQVPLRFPDGRLPTPRWRWFSRTTIVLIALGTAGLAVSGGDVGPGIAHPIGVPWIRERPVLLLVVALPLLACLPVSVASVVVRYRRADALQRTQIRWFAWASGLVIGLYLASFVVPGGALNDVVGLSYALIPLSIAVAVLRYRLYEIDRIISRTLAYALVTGAIVGTYVVVVTSLTRLVPASSTLAVAAATLAAAAVFRPVLRRVQAVVDRRFNRERYDAERIVDAFGARLRGETDPDAAAADLLSAVGRALQPGAVGLWVRDSRVGASR